MKSRAVTSFLSLLSLLVLTGCIESSTVLQVNKDGSGAILVREFLSTEAMSMMDGMQGMAEQMAAEFGGETPVEDGLSELPVIFQGLVQARLEEFGGNARLTATREATNDRGWKGYMARYEFDDVNAIRLTSSVSQDDEDAPAESAYSISFTPGDTAELVLIPQRAAVTPVAAAPEAESADLGEVELDDMEWAEDADLADLDLDMGGMMQGMDQTMSAMFGNMFKGMRMSLLIEVEGEIVETDALHRSAARPNRVALMDMDFDELMAHPDALENLMGNDPDRIYQLQEEGAPGILMEHPEKTVRIRFR